MAKKTRKPETADPIASLSDKSIHERNAAVRDLSLFGGVEHLSVLIEVAQKDKSPSVRLGAAAAASDILSRHRLPPYNSALSEDDRKALVAQMRGFNPAHNSGLFPILACLGLPAMVHRIIAGLRDPRGDVRVGAAVGLLRMLESVECHGNEILEAKVVNLLHESKLKPDAVASVAQVCSAVGFLSARTALMSLDLSGAHGEAVADALGVMDKASQPILGAWFSDGRDAGEVNPENPAGEQVALVSEDGALVRMGTEWTWSDSFSQAGLRRMYIRRVGEPTPGPAFQTKNRTWYMAGTDVLFSLMEELANRDVDLDWGQEGDAICARAAVVIEPHLDEAPGHWRDLGILYARGGRLEDAERCFQTAIAGKRTPSDTWFYLGELRNSLGDKAGALEAWQLSLKKTRSKKSRVTHLLKIRLGSDEME